jgi:hypothetical protein
VEGGSVYRGKDAATAGEVKIKKVKDFFSAADDSISGNFGSRYYSSFNHVILKRDTVNYVKVGRSVR